MALNVSLRSALAGLAALSFCLSGCPEDPENPGLAQLIEVGGICSDDAECRSGLCVDAVCVAANLPPLAVAGANRVTVVGIGVSLDGSASVDPDNDANGLAYAWSVQVAPAGATGTFSDAEGPSPTFTGDSAGVYELQLRVTDTDGATHADRVGVFVLDADGTFKVPEGGPCSDGIQCASGKCVDGICDANFAPTADAGASRTAPVGESLTLDGSGSSDVDGDTLTYVWELIAVPDGSSAVLTAVGDVATTLTPDQPGLYVARLRVNDGFLLSAPATVGIYASEADIELRPDGDPCDKDEDCASQFCFEGACKTNEPPIAIAGKAVIVQVGTTVDVDGSESSDPEGMALTYSWGLNEAPEGTAATLTDPAAATTTFTPDLPGVYVLRLVVDDGMLPSLPEDFVIYASQDPVDLLPDGSDCTTDVQCESAFCPGQVCATNAAPMADAGAPQEVAQGSVVTLDGSGSSDPEGFAVTYAWTLSAAPDGSSVALDDPTQEAPSFTADVPGLFQFELIVSDGQLDSLPSFVAIAVTASSLLPDGSPCVGDGECLSGYCNAFELCAVNVPPTADIAVTSPVTAGDAVALSGAGATDPEGDALSYAWALVSAPAGATAALDDPTAEAPGFVADLTGVYVVELVVSDAYGASIPATAVVQAAAVVNLPPVATIAAPVTADTGASVVLDGTGSSDPESAPLTYAWSLDVVPPGSTVVLSGAAADTASFDPDLPGAYVVSLVVDDGNAPSTAALHVVSVSVASDNLPDGDPCFDDVACASGFCDPSGVCACPAATCASLGAECGAPDNGCGDPLDCGSCSGGFSCNPTTNICDCAPVDCATLGAECGTPDDGCGAPLDCGTCPAVADGTTTCTSGLCELACDAGFHDCAGVCADDTDPATCGTSCTACPGPPSGHGSATCDGTSCGFACDTGYEACSGDCIDPLTDPNHCGGCGVETCSYVCVDGACENPWTLTVVAGDAQTVGPNQQAPLLLRVNVTDQGLVPANGLTLDVVTPSGAYAGSAVTDALGDAYIELWSGRALGDYTFTLSAAPASNAVDVTLTAQAYPDGTVYPLINHAKSNNINFVDGPGSQAVMRHAGSGGMGVASDNTLYLAHINGNEVIRLTPNGQATVIAGTGGTGGGGDFGPALDATFSTLEGVGLDETLQRLYTAERGTRRIRYIDLTDGTIYPFAGGGADTATDGDGGPATGAYLSNSRAVRVGPDSHVYLTDNNRIRRVDIGTNVIDHWVGSSVDGCGAEPSVQSCGDSSQKQCGIAWAPDGTAYVAASLCGGVLANANGILRIDTDGSRHRVAGNASGSTADGVGAREHQFNAEVRDVTLDAVGNLYVLASGSFSGGSSVIKRIDAVTTVVTTIAGGTYGAVGDYGPGVDARFNRPRSLHMTPAGNLVFFDHFNYSLRGIWNPGATALSVATLVKTAGDGGSAVVLGSPGPMSVQLQDASGTPLAGIPIRWSPDQAGTPPEALVVPTGIPDNASTIGPRVGLELTDYSWRAEFHDINGNPVAGSPAVFTATATAAGDGEVFSVINPTGQNGVFTQQPAVNAVINRPFGVDVGADGTIYIAGSDDRSVIRITPGAAADRVAGNGSNGFSGDGGPAKSAELSSVLDVAVDDTNHLLYIVDGTNDAIRVVDLDTGLINLFAGRGTATTAPFGDGGSPLDATFGAPVSVDVSPDGARVFVTDQRANVRVIEGGVISTLIQGGGSCTTSSVAMRAQASGGCNGFTCTANVDDHTGDLYVAAVFCGTAFPVTTGVNAIVRFPGGTGSPEAIAGAFNAAVSDGNDPLSTTFDEIKGIAVDAAGNILFAEGDKHLVRRINAATGLVETVVGDGNTGPIEEYAAPLSSPLNRPSFVAFHPDGHLLISEENGDRVRMMWSSCAGDAQCGTTGTCDLGQGGCVVP